MWFDLPLAPGSARGAAEDADLEMWATLKRLRTAVAGSDGERDYALQATISGKPATIATLRTLGDSLREALVVSHLTLVDDETLGDDEPRLLALNPPKATNARVAAKRCRFGRSRTSDDLRALRRNRSSVRFRSG